MDEKEKKPEPKPHEEDQGWSGDGGTNPPIPPDKPH